MNTRWIGWALVCMSIATPSGPAKAQGAPAGSDGAQAASSAPVAIDIPDSLMFSIDELNELRSRMSSGEADAAGSRSIDAIENASLYLSTILFYSPTEWTIWVNGVPIGPRQDLRSFEVTGIGPDYVELLVPLSAQGMKPVRLSPNQTFVARSGTVVEGKWVQ